MMAEKTQRIHFSQVAAAPAKAAARQLVAFAAVLLCSRAVIFGQYTPFAVAAVAAVPYSVLLSATLGGVLGCMLPSVAAVPVHYLAATVAAAAIRWALNDLAKLRSHPAFAPAAAFLSLMTTSAAVAIVSGSGFMATVMYVAESLTAGCAAYFFRQTVAAAKSGRSAGDWSQQEIACGAISACIFLLALEGLKIGNVSAGRICAVLLILITARYGGVAGGSIAGVAAGLAFSLSTSGLSYLSGAYALGGMMAGLFAPVGRLASAAAFVLSNGLASLQVGGKAEVTAGLYEVAAATVIYLLLPAKTGRFLIGFFTRSDSSEYGEGLRRSIVMKLDFAAEALQGVSESVEEVSRKLARTCSPDIGGVYHKAIDEVCHTCGLRNYCWEHGYNETMDAFNNLTENLRANGKVGRDDFCRQMKTHCGRLGEIAEAVNRNYSEFSVLEASESRARQVRGVVAQQFTTTGHMLEDMASDMEMFERFDAGAAQKAADVMRLAGMQPLEVSCRVDRFGRMTVEAAASAADCAHVKKGELAAEVSRACGRTFEIPYINTAHGKCRIRINEKARYRVKAGCAQHSCKGGKFCGDCWRSFPDGNGRQIAIISDGMGTGGRAAVDGAMACGIMESLVKADIGFDAALQIVNSALIAKSGDESLATMDIATLDMFSGEAEFLKAGAPATILRRDGCAFTKEMSGLPIGILNEVKFTRSADTLSAGDVIVMLSDGALSSGSKWICDGIEDWKGGIPQELAEEIVSQAIARRRDGHDDDITALVLMLQKAEN